MNSLEGSDDRWLAPHVNAFLRAGLWADRRCLLCVLGLRDEGSCSNPAGAGNCGDAIYQCGPAYEQPRLLWSRRSLLPGVVRIESRETAPASNWAATAGSGCQGMRRHTGAAVSD